MAEEPYVLLLSHSQEPFCTDRVARALAQRGARALRLDTDDFPGVLNLHTALDPDRPPRLYLNGEAVEVDAVWLWRLWPARLDERLSAAHREAAQRESGIALVGLLDLLGDAAWIDPLDANRAAENKTRQLRLAREVGLAIPPTLITADPAAARRFFAAHDGRVVAKMQASLGYAMRGGVLSTRLLEPGDLDALEGIRHCPMIFQRHVPKALELRIAWVDGEAWVGALDGARCGVDWRYEASARWQHHTLPEPIRERLAALMIRLGLRQGAIDVIVTPAGEYVFLEVNPTGEWGMLERDLGLPIGAALADALLRPRGRRER